MTSSIAQADEATDILRDYDLWAIQVVVREGKPMHGLTRNEKVLAAQLMRVKGVDSHTAGYRLGVNASLITKWWSREGIAPLDLIPPEVIGAPLPKYLITREDARLMTGN